MSVFVTLAWLNNIRWCHTCMRVGSWVNMCIFIVRGWGWREYEAFGLGSLKPSALTVKQKALSPQGGGRGTHCLAATWLLRAQWLLNLRGVEAWTPAWPPSQKTPGYLSPRLSLRHSARGREEKSCAAEKGKYPRDVSRVVSPGSGVKGRHGGGMSGVKWSRQANVGLVKCLPGDLLTCGQVGTQSTEL